MFLSFRFLNIISSALFILFRFLSIFSHQTTVATGHRNEVTTTISTGNLYVLFLDYRNTAGYIYWSDMNAGTITRYISIVSIISLQLSSFMPNPYINK
jgi:hypothetical protein